MEEFERLTKSVSQETQQRRQEERQRRQEERNEDLKKFRTLLGLPPEWEDHKDTYRHGKSFNPSADTFC